jgi:hypothetical protein
MKFSTLTSSRKTDRDRAAGAREFLISMATRPAALFRTVRKTGRGLAGFAFRWKPRFAALGANSAPFVYPSAGNPRVAVLVPGFRETRQVRYFSRLDDEEAVRFEPEVLAGTAAQLRRIALSRSPASVRNAVVVLTHEGEAGLAEYDRDMFWDVFGVPAFEQYLTRRRRLLASECDAHEGLHVCGPFSCREGWQLDRSPCDCGDPSPRLVMAPNFAAPALQPCVNQP